MLCVCFGSSELHSNEGVIEERVLFDREQGQTFA